MMKSNKSISINKFTMLGVAFLFAIIIAKLLYVAVSTKVDGIDLKKFALSRTTATKKITATRGTIYDANNEILAQNVRSYTVIAYLAESRTTDPDNPQHVVDKQMTAEKLSPLLNMKVETLVKMLSRDAYQVELRPGGYNISELLKQEIDALNLPGIDFIKSTKRDYPNGDFASYILGYAVRKDDGSIVGELGIEGKYNKQLTGTDGKLTYQKDAYGYKIANTPEVEDPATDGVEIYLTLDSNIQLYLENAMDKLEQVGIDWATLTIADAKTGAIVGSASTPSFDPNKLNIKDYNNPLVSYTYEPGSTMKIYSFMAAIDTGNYNGSEMYDSGNIVVDNYVISDWNRKGWGKISYDTGFTYSSNVAAVKLAEKIGKDTLLDYYEKFGFGSKTGIELSNELRGKLDFFYKSELASASYGQGITTTPIQNIQALTSISNKGIVLKPYIVKKIVDPNTGKTIYEGKRNELGRAVSENTVNKMIELMDLTVNGDDSVATGKKYHTDQVRLIGKTGTAQYTNSNGKYASGNYNNIRSFAGMFPKDDPEYIIYVSIKRLQTSGNYMGTVIKEVVESVAKYKNLNLRETSEDSKKIVKIANYITMTPSEVTSKLEAFGLTPIVIGDGEFITKQYPIKDISVLQGSKVFLKTNGNSYVMPNVIGWTKNEVITLAKLLNLSYNVNGYGNVTSVNINAGEVIDQNKTLEIELGG